MLYIDIFGYDNKIINCHMKCYINIVNKSLSMRVPRWGIHWDGGLIKPLTFIMWVTKKYMYTKNCTDQPVLYSADKQPNCL